MTPETALTTAVIGGAVGIVVAIIGMLSNRGTKAMEVKATTIQSEITELRTSLAAAREDIESLRAEVATVKSERDELWRENRDLRDQVRDQAELIEDFVAHQLSHAAWVTAGSTPPPPVMTWRIRERLDKERRMHAHQIRQQQQDQQQEE